ncbi:winged helix-turn-helix protein [Umezawaea tangerina]|uniref:Winged helix-turn-helix protein n=1 Tax=Umezawaea tangerina TaxID=84725 RepID=A0A2T0T7E0_9PSEU|nr:winged helix-turn-helix protein [Umezawaea tangerina]
MGRPTSLADEQLRKLYRLIRDRDPDDFGFDAALWTRAVVRLLVHREFGLSLSPPTVSKVLGELGLHPARSSPPADVLGAMAVIRARSARAGAKLFFGKVYRVDREGYREEGWPDHVASVIDGRGQIMFHLFPERPDPGHLTDFARRVVGDLSKPAFVVVSGSPDCADSLRRIAGGSHGRLSIFLVPDSRGGGADFMQM